MTATTTPARRRTAPPPARRPKHLEVVPAGYRSPRARRRRARLVGVAGVLLACGIVFALAGVHVLLTQGQFRLERLQRQDADAQAQYVRLRLEVAQLESPGRIVAEAQERLGMVPPNAVTYLTPSGPVPAPHPAASTGGAKTRKTPDTTQGWAAAKPALARRP